jgi:transposase-like protein
VLAVARLDRFGSRSDDGRVEEIEDRAESLRLKLRSSRDSRRRIPEELRAEAVAFARAAHASGERYKAIAATLGVKPDTLMRWCRAGREPKKFARVVVKRTAAPRLTVHGPAGTRIEQLSIAQAAELLRALSCSG